LLAKLFDGVLHPCAGMETYEVPPLDSHSPLFNGSLAVPFRPLRHWTDQKIVVHAFICILGLLLLKLRQLKLKEQNISLSLEIIKEELSLVQLDSG
jgi:hypothetical protein